MRYRTMFTVVGCALAGVAGCSDTTADAQPIDPTNTGPAEVLAPSQRAAATVAEPVIPAACDPTHVEVSAGVPSGIGKPDAIVLLTNVGTTECEVNLDGSLLLGSDVEPNVWLMPGEAGELWVITSENQCDRVSEPPAGSAGFPLEVNGVERSIDFVEYERCVALTAFFVADPF